MDSGTESEGFKSQPQDFDIEEPLDTKPSQLTNAGIIETWNQVQTQLSEETTRRHLTYGFGGLYATWVVVGLVVFVDSKNSWLLVSIGVLALPLRKILNYYFPRRSKK